MRLVQSFAMESSSSLAIEQPSDENLRNYALSVITEVRFFDPIYSIMEKERKILNGSQIFSAHIGSELLEFIRDDQFTLFSNLADRHRRGTHKGIKLITSIDHSTAPLVSGAIGLEIKHRPDSNPIEFVVSDTAILDITHGRNKGRIFN
jgi:hypothetical protein